MKSLLLILLLLPFGLFSQVVDLVTTLVPTISETSGLLQLNGRFITHNDSGGSNRLYEIDTTNGQVIRTVVVDSAVHVDWEAICSDDQFIYIGDFGNNSGTRTNLAIYRVEINDYLTSTNDTVTSDKIEFAYNDQIDFSPATFTTNFDAEAFLALGDSLYIFTKNWGNTYSNVYSLPKIPGNYQALRRDSIPVGGLITGATKSNSEDTIWFCGYTPFNAVLGQLTNIDLNSISQSNIDFYSLDCPESFQIEGMTVLGNQLYCSAESHSSGSSSLYRIQSNTLLVNESQLDDINIYPNPTYGKITIEGEYESIKIYTTNGVEIGEFDAATIQDLNLEAGSYFIDINTKSRSTVKKKIVVL